MPDKEFLDKQLIEVDDLTTEDSKLEETARSLRDIDELTRTRVIAAILQLRVMGIRYEQIATLVNAKYNLNINKAAVHRLYNGHLEKLPKETLDQSRQLAILRATEIFQISYERGKQGSAKYLEIALNTNKQIIEMLGLDAPQEIVVTDNEQAANVRSQLINRFEELSEAGDSKLIN